MTLNRVHVFFVVVNSYLLLRATECYSRLTRLYHTCPPIHLPAHLSDRSWHFPRAYYFLIDGYLHLSRLHTPCVV
ncbi:hypothetical protein BDZ97DRAFT_1837812 [Flammula alnicola]|nr:hypothetical protein BDZ97DRAFT_1837812 [Flammula alnicola]